MTKKDEKSSGDSSVLKHTFRGEGIGDGAMIHKISPLGMRVVVRILPDNNRTEGGLYLPEGTKEAMQESILAEVIEVAVAHDDEFDEETNISGIPLHAQVLIAKDVGIKVPWDDSLRIIETIDVLALVDDITVT